VIKGFAGRGAEDLFHGINSKESRKIPQNLWPVAHRKLDMLNAAHALQDLAVPLANRLEALKGDWKGYFSVRINEQYRVVFKWETGDAYEVQIVDYH
jgi:proteic killer suppression protein